MRTYHLRKHHLYFLPVVIVALLLSSCARKMTFAVSPVVPAATGTVKVKKDNNNNYDINVQVAHLAPAGRLDPPQKTYIVWMVTQNNGTQNIGQLKSSKGLLSGKFKGSLKTTTVFKPKRFFITAEDNATVQYAGDPIILQTE